MPTAPGFADCSIQLQHSLVSRPTYITFGVDATDTDPNVVAQGVLTATSTAGSLVNKLDSNVTIINCRVSLGTDGSEDLVGEAAGSTVGAAAGSTVPANCALLVHKITTRGGRRGRGRLFIPWCVSAADVGEGGLIVAATVSALQTVISQWRINLASGGNPMVLLHQPSKPGTDAPTVPGPPDAVTALVVDKLISTQRRRLGR